MGAAMTPGVGEEAMHMARDAMHRIDKHEDVCAERYEQIVKNQEASATDRKEVRGMISSRFKDLYGFLWKIAFAFMGAQFTLLMALVFFMLKGG